MITKLENVKQPKLTQPQTEADNRAMNLAASWYVAMRSKALGNKPKAIELFGQPLVAWRDHKGHPVIMERHCSHLGISLAVGKVVDGCIQCPFHHWRYDHSGQCVSIPEVDHIPPRARQATYVTAERYGFIWIWYGSKSPLFPLPEFPAAEDNKHEYILSGDTERLKTTVRRALENSFDEFHFATLHQTCRPNRFGVLDDQSSPLLNDPPIQKDAWYGYFMEFPLSGTLGKLDGVAKALGLHGKAYTVVLDCWPSGQRGAFWLDGKEIAKFLSVASPIAENNTIVEGLVAYKKTSYVWLDILKTQILGLTTIITARQDRPVFNDVKIDIDEVYVKHDLGIVKFRKLYQSWVDKVE